MLDYSNYDKITPNTANNKNPIVNDNYRRKGANFRVGIDALRTYGKL